MRVKGPDGRVIEFPDGTPPETVKAAMAKQYGSPSAPEPVMTASANPFMSLFQGSKERAADVLPAIGGFAGGALGGIAGAAAGGLPAFGLGVGGAAAGGALGETAKEAILGRKLDPKTIATQGAVEGGLQAAGGTIAKGASMAARPIMRRALGVGKAIGGKVKIGSRLFPDPTETALEKGIEVSPKGAEAVTALRQDSAKKLSGLLKKATKKGTTFDTDKVAKYVEELTNDPVLPSSVKDRVMSELTEFYKDKGAKVTPQLAQKIKQYYQRRARGVYKAGEEGAFTLADQPSGQFAEQLAKGAREQLETIPGVSATNRETQRLIGLEKAVQRAVQRPAPPFEVFRPGTYPFLSRLAGHDVLSKTAVGLSDPDWQALMRQSPRMVNLLLARLSQPVEPDATR